MKENAVEIINDYTSGSEKLTEKVLSFVKNCYENGEDWRKYKNEIIEAHPEMVQINNIFKLIDFFEEEKIEKIKLKLNEIKKKAIVNSKKIFNGEVRVTTLSYSSLVYRAIMENKDKIVQVNVLESGPGYEGIKLFNDLNKNGVKSFLYTDSEIYHALKESDMAIVGMDAVKLNLNIINKTGTFSLASSSKVFKIPLYCIGTSVKISEGEIKFKSYPAKKNNIYRENFLFDETPSSLISGFILDLGFFGRKKFSYLSGIISRKDFLKNLFVNGE